MYVSDWNGLVLVGDRANNWIVVFDGSNFSVKRIIPAGTGIFHQSAPSAGTQLWVNNDIDKTITVVDLKRLYAVKTIPIPSDLAENYIPHDLTLTWDSKAAFATYLGGEATEEDVIIKYDTETYTEVARAYVGKDPHVTTTFRTNTLYVAQQGSDQVSFLSQDDLTPVAPPVTVPDAHGTIMFAPFDDVLYVSDIADDANEDRGLYAISLETNEIIGKTLDSQRKKSLPGVYHNLAGTGERLFVTHTGSNIVSVWNTKGDNVVPKLRRTVQVGENPFGLCFVESTCDVADIN